MNNSLRIYAILIVLSWVIQDGKAIYGGTVAEKGQFKYVALLQLPGNRICSGSIISDRHVLTAGHCVFNRLEQDILVIIGDILILGDKNTVFRDVEKITVHKDFKDSDRNPSDCKLCAQRFCCFLERRELNDIPTNDIAVLTLQEEVNLGNGIEVIPYKPSAPLTNCGDCVLAGWGRMQRYYPTFHLRWTTLTILTRAQCEYRHTIHRDNEFCAVDLDRKSVPLDGDSGSAIVCNGYAVGVQSTTVPHVDYPATFARIADHYDFIDGIVNKRKLSNNK